MLNYAYRLGALAALNDLAKIAEHLGETVEDPKESPMVELLVSKLKEVDEERVRRMQGQETGGVGLPEIDRPVIWGPKHIVSKSPDY